jgi:RNA polymerase sigma-70 factor (ECF subfamily)
LSIVEACPAARHTIGVAALRLPSDQDLVARMADGDQSALRELMRRNRGRLRLFVARRLNDRDQIDDVINDTFMAAWRQAAKFEGRASVATWLLAIAKKRAWKMRQQHRRPEESLDDDHAATLADHRDTPDMVLEHQDGAKVLRRLTANLPANQAQLINLVYYRGKSLREVAAILRIPDNTVKSRMFLARRRLATLLSAEGVNQA